MNNLLLQLNELIEFDPQKRLQTLLLRDLDFARAGEIFADATATFVDVRSHYGECRYVTYGFLDDRLTVLVWTRREKKIRVISMRRANERENKKYSQRVG
ncbi:BrnT family toxin [Polynucleobacter necessarius]|uniref:BrnT family toxin n=1 Tax=Polynucleobacter necessarius TaxID=576610 RepID=UPI001E574035|nr:BrnT family toxin [Polynucleobacter necessarius]